MILGNLLRNLRQQNWFGIFLELAVVILGIFLGLEASEWNQKRLDRQDAAYHLNFFYTELLATIESTDKEIAQHEATLNRSFAASMLMTRESWNDAEREQFVDSIGAAYELWGPKHRPVSLRRMIDDGKLDLIESKTIQNAILNYESAYLDAIDQTETSYNYSLVLTPQITASMTYRGRSIISSSEELLSSKALRASVRDKVIWQRVQFDVLEKLQDERRKLKGILEVNGIGSRSS